MYSENVIIYVNGKGVTMRVPCSPGTSQKILKRRALKMYLHAFKKQLKLENNLQGEDI